MKTITEIIPLISFINHKTPKFEDDATENFFLLSYRGFLFFEVLRKGRILSGPYCFGNDAQRKSWNFVSRIVSVVVIFDIVSVFVGASVEKNFDFGCFHMRFVVSIV